MTAGIPKEKAPPGTWDTHMHIYDQRYPKAATAKIVHPDVLASDYDALRKRLGIEHTVVVQPTAYGTDNRCTLKAMADLGPGTRGVAVVDESVSDAELERLTKLGIRGIRYFMLPGGALSWESLHTMADRVGNFGWHVQLQLDGRDLPEREDTLKRLKGTLVVDHTGKFLEPVEPDHPGFVTLRRMLQNGRTWVKLSAPYETSKTGAPFFDDVGKLGKILAEDAPDRMVWASNWPHPTPQAGQKPDDAMLLDVLLDWVPDAAARKKVLVDNPAKLYA